MTLLILVKIDRFGSESVKKIESIPCAILMRQLQMHCIGAFLVDLYCRSKVTGVLLVVSSQEICTVKWGEQMQKTKRVNKYYVLTSIHPLSCVQSPRFTFSLICTTPACFILNNAKYIMTLISRPYTLYLQVQITTVPSLYRLSKF